MLRFSSGKRCRVLAPASADTNWEGLLFKHQHHERVELGHERSEQFRLRRHFGDPPFQRAGVGLGVSRRHE